MTLTRYTRLRMLAVATMALPVLCLATPGIGCSQDGKTGGPEAGGASGGRTVAPAAKPGAQIGANNPPPGQPGHMSPEMQAQLQRYQSLGNKK